MVDKMQGEILVCEEKKIIVPRESYCKDCKGCEGEYLQGYNFSQLHSLIEKKYKWAKC